MNWDNLSHGQIIDLSISRKQLIAQGIYVVTNFDLDVKLGKTRLYDCMVVIQITLREKVTFDMFAERLDKITLAENGEMIFLEPKGSMPIINIYIGTIITSTTKLCTIDPIPAATDHRDIT